MVWTIHRIRKKVAPLFKRKTNKILKKVAWKVWRLRPIMLKQDNFLPSDVFTGSRSLTQGDWAGPSHDLALPVKSFRFICCKRLKFAFRKTWSRRAFALFLIKKWSSRIIPSWIIVNTSYSKQHGLFFFLIKHDDLFLQPLINLNIFLVINFLFMCVK